MNIGNLETRDLVARGDGVFTWLEVSDSEGVGMLGGDPAERRAWLQGFSNIVGKVDADQVFITPNSRSTTPLTIQSVTDDAVTYTLGAGDAVVVERNSYDSYDPYITFTTSDVVVRNSRDITIDTTVNSQKTFKAISYLGNVTVTENSTITAAMVTLSAEQGDVLNNGQVDTSASNGAIYVVTQGTPPSLENLNSGVGNIFINNTFAFPDSEDTGETLRITNFDLATQRIEGIYGYKDFFTVDAGESWSSTDERAIVDFSGGEFPGRKLRITNVGDVTFSEDVSELGCALSATSYRSNIGLGGASFSANGLYLAAPQGDITAVRVRTAGDFYFNDQNNQSPDVSFYGIGVDYVNGVVKSPSNWGEEPLEIISFGSDTLSYNIGSNRYIVPMGEDDAFVTEFSANNLSISYPGDVIIKDCINLPAGNVSITASGSISNDLSSTCGAVINVSSTTPGVDAGSIRLRANNNITIRHLEASGANAGGESSASHAGSVAVAARVVDLDWEDLNGTLGSQGLSAAHGQGGSLVVWAQDSLNVTFGDLSSNDGYPVGFSGYDGGQFRLAAGGEVNVFWSNLFDIPAGTDIGIGIAGSRDGDGGQVSVLAGRGLEWSLGDTYDIEAGFAGNTWFSRSAVELVSNEDLSLRVGATNLDNEFSGNFGFARAKVNLVAADDIDWRVEPQTVSTANATGAVGLALPDDPQEARKPITVLAGDNFDFQMEQIDAMSGYVGANRNLFSGTARENLTFRLWGTTGSTAGFRNTDVWLNTGNKLELDIESQGGFNNSPLSAVSGNNARYRIPLQRTPATTWLAASSYTPQNGLRWNSVEDLGLPQRNQNFGCVDYRWNLALMTSSWSFDQGGPSNNPNSRLIPTLWLATQNNKKRRGSPNPKAAF